jgi:hypothetical protein
MAEGKEVNLKLSPDTAEEIAKLAERHGYTKTNPVRLSLGLVRACLKKRRKDIRL